MQEEVTQKTIALSMKTGKLTSQALQAALKKYLQHRAKGPKLHHGKQSLNRRSGSSRPKRSPRSSGPLSARCWQQPSRKPPSSRNVRKKKSSKGGWNDET